MTNEIDVTFNLADNKLYLIEKMTEALEALATDAGDVRYRLTLAYLCVMHLKAEDFPLELRNDWSAFIDALTKKGPSIASTGDVRLNSAQNTMRSIQNKTATKLAKAFFEMYSRLQIISRL
jgi:hypothetical protein